MLRWYDGMGKQVKTTQLANVIMLLLLNSPHELTKMYIMKNTDKTESQY